MSRFTDLITGKLSQEKQEKVASDPVVSEPTVYPSVPLEAKKLYEQKSGLINFGKKKHKF